MPAPQLIVATSSPGKIAELVALLGDRFEVLPRPSELAETIEDGDTLEANATKKAVEVANHANALALADDTGLFADALAGRPGVHTARFAGEEATDAENVAKLLAALEGSSDRRARFRTVIAVADTEGNVKLSTGTVEGSIATEIRGADGFGYDPVFIPDEADGRTFAEMTKAEKNQISHRARALQAMLTELRT